MEPDRNAEWHERGLWRRLLRRLGSSAQPHLREGAVVAIASGKGGTGKSFVTTNAALALHAAGRRVAVVDCDFGLANAHLLLGVNPRYSLHHLLEGGIAVDQVLAATPYGPTLLAGGSGIAGLAELDARHLQTLARALQWIAARHDVVLLDCAAGLSPQALVMVLSADHVVVVTNPEIAALTDAYALIKCIARQPAQPALHLAVNRVATPGLGEATFERLAQVARRFAGCQIHYLGELPEDPTVTHRRLGQAPLLRSAPQCATTKAILAMSGRLAGQLAMRRRPPDQGGIEARMLAQLRRW